MPGFRSGASANQLALCLNPGKILGRWLEQTKVATGSFVSPNPGRRVLGLFHSVETQLRCALVKSTKSDCNGTRRNTGSERSSAWLEHLLWEQDVAGSNPVAPTIFTWKIANSLDSCAEFARNPPRTPDRRVRFPATIRHRQSKVKFYAPGKNFDYFRLSFTVAGKRQMRSFRQYSDAKAQAGRLVQ